MNNTSTSVAMTAGLTGDAAGVLERGRPPAEVTKRGAWSGAGRSRDRRRRRSGGRLARAAAFASTAARAQPLVMIALLMLTDLAALSVSGLLAIVLWHPFTHGDGHVAYLHAWPAMFVFIVGYACVRLYPNVPLSPADELRRLTVVTSLSCMALATGIFLTKGGDHFSRATGVMAWVLALMLVPAARSTLRMMVSRRPWWGYPVLVIGSGATAAHAVRSLRRQPETGLKPVAVVAHRDHHRSRFCGLPVIGSLSACDDAARRLGVRHALLVTPDLPRPDADAALDRLRHTLPHVLLVPHLGSGAGSLWVGTVDLAGVLSLEVRHRLLDRGRLTLKRIIDVALIIAFSPLLLPLLATLWLLVRLTARGPVMYSQPRVGRGGRPFTLWKFRTMRRGADILLHQHLERDPGLRHQWRRHGKLHRDPRVTRIGRFLRATSLDELPQVWNVLNGTMSLVGPRPVPADELTKYGDIAELYKQVRPGITGIWQVSGRSRTTYEERVSMDAYYVRNWSVWLDLHLLSRTALAVVLQKGAC